MRSIFADEDDETENLTSVRFVLVCKLCSSGYIDDSSGIFNAATIVRRVPIHLPLIEEDEDRDATAQRNASAYRSENANVEGEFRLPAELAALIANAKSRPSRMESPVENGSSDIRYYATYADSELCSSKKSSTFQSWEESFASMEDCCDTEPGHNRKSFSFSWSRGVRAGGFCNHDEVKGILISLDVFV